MAKATKPSSKCDYDHRGSPCRDFDGIYSTPQLCRNGEAAGEGSSASKGDDVKPTMPMLRLDHTREANIASMISASRPRRELRQ